MIGRRGVIPAAALTAALGTAASGDIDAVTWIGAGSGSWFDARNWSLGVVPWNDGRFNFLAIIPESPRGDLSISIGSDMPVIDALSVGGGASLDIHAGAGLAIAGGSIDDVGTIGLWASFGEPVTLRLDAEETILHGTGRVIGGDGAATIRAANPTGRLVHAKGHRIEGAMALGDDSLRLTNEGEIVSQNGKITIDLSDGADVNRNSGRMAADAPGSLVLHDFALDNDGGVIESMPGAKVRLDWVNLIGGTLRDVDGAGPGTVRITGDTSLEGVTVEGPISIGDYGLLRLRSGTHLGDLHQEGEGPISTVVRIEAVPFSIAAGTTWTAAIGTANQIIGGVTAATLEVERGAVITGLQRLGGDSLRLHNHGVVEASGAGRMAMDLADGAGLNDNDGIVRAVNGATLDIVDCTIDNTGGVIEAGEGSMVHFGPSAAPFNFGDVHLAGGVVRAVGGDIPGRIQVSNRLWIDPGTEFEGVVRLASDSSGSYPYLWIHADAPTPPVIEMSGPDFQEPLAYLVRYGAGLAVYSDCTVAGWSANSSINCVVAGTLDQTVIVPGLLEASATFSGGILFYFNGGLTNRGRIEAPPKNSIQFGGGAYAMENMETGVIDLAAAPSNISQTWSAGVVNRGVFFMGAKRTITAGVPGFTQESGVSTIDGTLQFNGSAPPVTVNGGVLAGSGSIAKRTENSGGTVAPGSAGGVGTVGTLSITLGEFVQNAGGMLDVDLGAPADSSVNPGDRVAVTGAAQIDGTLRVRLVDGFVPMAGEAFVVLTASTVTGVFARVESEGHCEPFDVIYAPTSVSVVFAGGSAGGADINDDGVVDGDDLGTLLGAWGTCGSACCPADLDRDGAVDGDDLGALLGAWS